MALSLAGRTGNQREYAAFAVTFAYLAAIYYVEWREMSAPLA